MHSHWRRTYSLPLVVLYAWVPACRARSCGARAACGRCTPASRPHWCAPSRPMPASGWPGRPSCAAWADMHKAPSRPSGREADGRHTPPAQLREVRTNGHTACLPGWRALGRNLNRRLLIECRWRSQSCMAAMETGCCSQEFICPCMCREASMSVRHGMTRSRTQARVAQETAPARRLRPAGVWLGVFADELR